MRSRDGAACSTSPIGDGCSASVFLHCHLRKKELHRVSKVEVAPPPFLQQATTSLTSQRQHHLTFYQKDNRAYYLPDIHCYVKSHLLATLSYYSTTLSLPESSAKGSNNDEKILIIRMKEPKTPRMEEPKPIQSSPKPRCAMKMVPNNQRPS